MLHWVRKALRDDMVKDGRVKEALKDCEENLAEFTAAEGRRGVCVDLGDLIAVHDYIIELESVVIDKSNIRPDISSALENIIDQANK